MNNLTRWMSDFTSGPVHYLNLNSSSVNWCLDVCMLTQSLSFFFSVTVNVSRLNHLIYILANWFRIYILTVTTELFYRKVFIRCRSGCKTSNQTNCIQNVCHFIPFLVTTTFTGLFLQPLCHTLMEGKAKTLEMLTYAYSFILICCVSDVYDSECI